MLERILLSAVLLFCSMAVGQSQSQPKSCLIVHQHHYKFGEAMSRWTAPKPFDYIEGEFPVGMKFRTELKDATIREVQKKGGKVVIMKQEFSKDDLEDARAQCKAFQEVR